MKIKISNKMKQQKTHSCSVKMDPGIYCLYRAHDKDRIDKHKESHGNAVANKLRCKSRRYECNWNEVAEIMVGLNSPR